jgi:hypothetical protein
VAENALPAQGEPEIPANPVLDLQTEDESDEVEAHCGFCISVVSVVLE